VQFALYNHNSTTERSSCQEKKATEDYAAPVAFNIHLQNSVKSKTLP